MANILKVKFNSQPATNDSIFLTTSSGTDTKTFGSGAGQVAIGGNTNATATNYKNAINATAGFSATLDINNSNIVLIQSTAAYVTAAYTLPAGRNFASLSSIAASGVSGDGETVNISVDTVDRALKFLSTEFMDLGGKNNQVAYRNPKYLNFASPDGVAPSPGPNARVVICKDASSGNGNYIRSYLDGEEGGSTPNGAKPGWEWWSRSFMIYDTSGGDAQNILNSIILNGSHINQNTSTCTWYPGSNALSNSAPSPIAGSCANTIETPYPAASAGYSYKAIFTGNYNGTSLEPTFKILSNVTGVSGTEYSSTITIDAPTGYGFDGNNSNFLYLSNLTTVDSGASYNSPNGHITTDNQVFTGTVTNGYYPSVTISFMDSNFGGSGNEKEFYFSANVYLLNSQLAFAKISETGNSPTSRTYVWQLSGNPSTPKTISLAIYSTQQKWNTIAGDNLSSIGTKYAAHLNAQALPANGVNYQYTWSNFTGTFKPVASFNTSNNQLSFTMDWGHQVIQPTVTSPAETVVRDSYNIWGNVP